MTYVYKCVRCGLEFAVCLFNTEIKDVPFPNCFECGAASPAVVDFDPEGSKIEFLFYELERLRQRIEILENRFDGVETDPTQDMVTH